MKFATSNSKKTVGEHIIGLIFLFFGLTVAHFGVSLFILSDLGKDTFTTLVSGIAGVVGLSVGTCHVIICSLLVVIMFFTTEGYVKAGTLVCAFGGGWIIDLFNYLLGRFNIPEQSIYIRLGVMVGGCIFLSLGMSVVINSDSGTGPNDLIPIILNDKINDKKERVSFRLVRILCDAVYVGIGFLLGEMPGIGTICAVVLTGPVVQFFLPITAKFAPPCCRNNFTELSERKHERSK